MRAFPWILGGGAAALAAYYWHRDHHGADQPDDDHGQAHAHDSSSQAPADSKPAPAVGPSSSTAPEPLPGRWVWPVGVWNGRKPEISDGFHSKRHDPQTGAVIEHGGVDIMYRRQAGDPWRAGTPNATSGWVMPDHRAALAASDGVVWLATNTPRGWSVVIDHSPRKLATYYTHMSSLLVSAKQQVTAGTPLGIIGFDPLDGARTMHLHTEVWRGGREDRFDPQKLIETTWEYVPDPGDLPRALVARNGGHRPKDGSSYSIPVTTHYRRVPRR